MQLKACRLVALDRFAVHRAVQQHDVVFLAVFLDLAQPGVQQLSPYVPGKPVDELARELNLDPSRIVKLASNENPLGPSPKVLAAIREELAELTRYPDGNGFALKSLLAEKCRVELNQVTLGNGSNDILELVGRAYLLHVVAADLPAFQQLYDDRLTSLPNVQRLTSKIGRASCRERV